MSLSFVKDFLGPMRKDCTTFTQTQGKILAPLCQFVVQRADAVQLA